MTLLTGAGTRPKAMKGDPSIVLHVMLFDKFIAPYIDFLEAHFADFERHRFYCFGDEATFPVRSRPNTRFPSDRGEVAFALDLVRMMNRAERIILHGLFSDRLIQLLALQPWLLRKCCWVIWGADLYEYRLVRHSAAARTREALRRFVIRRIGHLVTYTEGDVALAREWYGARGQYHRCLSYPSNLFHAPVVPTKADQTVRIQVGNSADPANEHLDVLQRLLPFLEQDVQIYVPLAYGDPDNARRVAAEGARLFGPRFTALTEFVPLDAYLRFLGNIDICIFNHHRQQGMGNALTLLGLGKKVYLRPDTTSWELFHRMGVTVFDAAKIDLAPIDPGLAARNRALISSQFCEERLIEQWRDIFDGAAPDS